MPFKIDWEPYKEEIIKLYINGVSPAQLSTMFPFKRTTIKEFLKRNNILRTQSESSHIAIKNNRKDKAIKQLILSAKTTNRNNPKKRYTIKKQCKSCSKIYVATSRQKWCKECVPNNKYRSLMMRYNLTKAQHDEMLLKQNFKCALCPKTATYVDHCHDTGLIRGILCSLCNILMSRIDQDDKWIEKIYNYKNGLMQYATKK